MTIDYTYTPFVFVFVSFSWCKLQLDILWFGSKSVCNVSSNTPVVYSIITKNYVTS